MACRYGVRNQKMLFPPSIEDYVAEDDPVRAYDIFVGEGKGPYLRRLKGHPLEGKAQIIKPSLFNN